MDVVLLERWTEVEAIKTTQTSTVQSGRAPGVETTKFRLAVVPLVTTRVTVAACAIGADNASKPKTMPQMRNVVRMFMVSGSQGLMMVISPPVLRASIPSGEVICAVEMFRPSMVAVPDRVAVRVVPIER